MSGHFTAHDGLISGVEALWDASLSVNTRRTYKAALLCFFNFMYMSGISGFRTYDDGLPHITENFLMLFVAHCHNKLKLRHCTIKLYLAGIRFSYLRAGHFYPLEGTRLQYILRGVLKSQDNNTVKRLPITSDILHKLCTLLSKGVFSPFLDLMLQCIFKLAFFGFLRCGEFTSRNVHTSQTFVQIQDVSLRPNYTSFQFHLRSSKTDPFHTGVNIVIYENDLLKPVYTMSSYLELRCSSGASVTAPLFVEDEFLNVPLSRDKFISMLKQCLLRLGYNDARYCGHSFRSGSATSAAAMGIEDHVIKTMGRWSSDCYVRYITTDANVIRNAQSLMAKSGVYS